MAIRYRRALLLVTIVGSLVLSVERAETHKPITSKYTYNDDVFPVLRERCGGCHVPGGVAPMSLMTYGEALPWSEAIRAEVIAGHMPPWHAQYGAVRFRNAPAITAAELDKILVWVSGGSPQGSAQNVPQAVLSRADWPAGTPDVVLQLPPSTLAPDRSDVTEEFTIPIPPIESGWIRSVDLLPGTPAIVRSATIAVKASAPASELDLAPERVLAVWVPGEAPVDPDIGAFRAPAGSELVVRVHYKKTYSYEGKEITDRSAVGLYLAKDSREQIRRFTVASARITDVREPVSFARELDEDLRALAVRPDPSLTNVRLQVDAVTSTGVRTPVIRLAVRPDWTRRYWFDQPLALPRGSRIEVVAAINDADGLLPPAGTPLPPQPVDGTPVRVMFDVVAGR